VSEPANFTGNVLTPYHGIHPDPVNLSGATP